MEMNRICCNCGSLHYENELTCWICRHNTRIATKEEIANALQKEKDEEKERQSQYIRSLAQKAFNESNFQNSPKCPLCKSPNIKKISATKRVAHGAAFGLFSNTARSQWECLNCGNKF